MEATLTFKEYVKAFAQRDLKKWLANILLIGGPAAGVIPKLRESSILWPPVGSDVIFFIEVIAFLLLGSVFFVKDTPLIKPGWWRTGVLVSLVVMMTISFVLYCGWYRRVVRRIDIATEDKTLFVVIGLERTQFAQSTFPDGSDEEMLKSRGISDEELRRLWTPTSLNAAHNRLLLYYGTMLLFPTAAYGFVILLSSLDAKANKGATPRTRVTAE